jgi:hypothetical protein
MQSYLTSTGDLRNRDSLSLSLSLIQVHYCTSGENLGSIMRPRKLIITNPKEASLSETKLMELYLQTKQGEIYLVSLSSDKAEANCPLMGHSPLIVAKAPHHHIIGSSHDLHVIKMTLNSAHPCITHAIAQQFTQTCIKSKYAPIATYTEPSEITQLLLLTIDLNCECGLLLHVIGRHTDDFLSCVMPPDKCLHARICTSAGFCPAMHRY